MNRLKILIDKLGKTETEIANTLLVMGLTGIPSDSCHCPVSNYLMAEGYQEVCVCDWNIAADQEELIPSVAMSRFIKSFDQDQYPELIEENRHGF
jgi:hypothetical protein